MDQIKKDNNDNIIELDALRKKKAEDFHLPEEKVALMQKLRDSEEIFTLFSLCTKCPYVVCDPETFDDEVILFFNGEDAQEEARHRVEEKIPVNIVRLEKEQKLLFFSNLFTMGVNALLIKHGEETRCIQLEELVKRRKPEQEEGKVWVENPELLLTILYYTQEIRRRPGVDQEPAVKALEEEMLAHFKKGRYIFAVEEESKQTPLVKLKEDLFHPIFTDIMEFQRFNREKKFLPVVVTAANLPKQIAPNAKGVVIDPVSVNMVLNLNIKRPAPMPAAQPVNPEEKSE